MSTAPIINVDMDGVLAGFDEWIIHQLTTYHPHVPVVRLAQRKTFYTTHSYEEPHLTVVRQVLAAERFFADLPPIPGAIEALKEMAEVYKVFLCTSPYDPNPWCASEKLEWVKRHLGEAWVKRTYLLPDKTMMRGDLLIDDRPEVTGIFEPTWTHVLYTQPYNAHLNGDSIYRLSWDDSSWRETIEAALRHKRR